MKNFLKVCIVSLLCLMSASAWAQEDGVIRILAIGNSFSADAVEQHLHKIASAGGYKLVIGNMRIGGCTLQKHLDNAMTNKPAYKYVKITLEGKWTITKDIPLCEALGDEQWDYVTFQQQSGRSGIYETWEDSLPDLVEYVRKRVPATTKVLIHQTWAYDPASQHKGFINYDNDQEVMYRSIVDAVERASKLVKADGVIPSGTAIQNARTTMLRDSVTRDGYHLHKIFGRYIAACTYYETIFRKSVVGNSYSPQGMTPEQKAAAQKSAHSAVRRPDNVTQIK